MEKPADVRRRTAATSHTPDRNRPKTPRRRSAVTPVSTSIPKSLLAGCCPGFRSAASRVAAVRLRRFRRRNGTSRVAGAGGSTSIVARASGIKPAMTCGLAALCVTGEVRADGTMSPWHRRTRLADGVQPQDWSMRDVPVPWRARWPVRGKADRSEARVGIWRNPGRPAKLVVTAHCVAT